MRLTEDGGGVVSSGDAEYVVRLEDGVMRCTCAWYAKHRGERGPCKHVLAVQHARRGARRMSVSDRLLRDRDPAAVRE